ncbi:hypothetical protein KIN20_015328 [Parelaphostrongylus tenuis]|uniref:Uncharacterized protein n=1 Tax=Parelaphostrongylus tenuis TaxID=148309 RepID=A0AAD5N0I2_PARTN|nr:hypothetical protein KIN20_015328 [Parelaphostrongylus tenuis]
MGNVIYTDHVACHDSLEACESHCKIGDCVFADICNGVANKFTCFPFDYRFITLLLFGCFLIVLFVCSSLVACYACRAIRESLRWQMAHTPNRDIVFNYSGPIRHIPIGTMEPRHVHESKR